MGSEAAAYEPGSIRRSTATANRFMGLTNNGGVNSFLTSAYDLDGSEELLSALDRHVLENKDFYLALPKHPLSDWDGAD